MAKVIGAVLHAFLANAPKTRTWARIRASSGIQAAGYSTQAVQHGARLKERGGCVSNFLLRYEQ
jgi:hypothetical protein